MISQNEQMLALLNMMFISPQQGDDKILLSRKRGADGLSHKNLMALSDFAGGASKYAPEKIIFPQYAKNAKCDFSVKMNRHFAALQKRSFESLVPHPALLPLLKGNVGEAIFDMFLEHIGIAAMSDEEVFRKLAPVVYEFFDRFIELGNVLVCVDVKNWATMLDNYERAEETVEKGARKIDQVRDVVVMGTLSEGQEQVRTALDGRYKSIKYVYLNTAYSQNPNNLMWEENVDHTVHYLNMFQVDHEYERPRDRETKALKSQFRLKRGLKVNPRLRSILSTDGLLNGK